VLPIKTNKADLEQKKIIFLEIGIIISLLIVYFTLNIKLGSRENLTDEFFSSHAIEEELAPVTIQETKPPPPVPPQIVTQFNIVDNSLNVVEEIEINTDATQETVIPEYVPVAVEDFHEEEEDLQEETIFVIVETMPLFPGGLLALREYLYSSLRYPTLAKETNIQGTVYLTFVVEKDGSVSDVSILRGIGGGCDEEAIKVVKQMPKWSPGKQRNVPVRVRYNLPVKFVLK
jgi:protein TonB